MSWFFFLSFMEERRLTEVSSKAISVISYLASENPKDELVIIRRHSSSFVQSFDVAALPDRNTLKILLYQTEEASIRGQLLARSKEVDFLMRLAGSDQIKKAMELAGAKPGKPSVMIFYGSSKQVTGDTTKALSALRGARILNMSERTDSGQGANKVEVSALLGLRKLRRRALR